MRRVSLDEARAAKPEVMRRFGEIGEVVGIGISRLGGDYAVKVNLSTPIQPGVDVPTHVEGVPIIVEVTGPIRPR